MFAFATESGQGLGAVIFLVIRERAQLRPCRNVPSVTIRCSWRSNNISLDSESPPSHPCPADSTNNPSLPRKKNGSLSNCSKQWWKRESKKKKRKKIRFVASTPFFPPFHIYCNARLCVSFFDNNYCWRIVDYLLNIS